MRNPAVTPTFVLLLFAAGCGTPSPSSSKLAPPKGPMSSEAYELAAAVNAGDGDALAKTINRGVNPFIVMWDEGTMLHGACIFRKEECVVELLKVAPLDEINRQDINGRTPLHFAADTYVNNTPIITLLLNAGADPTIRDNAGDLPSDVARKGNHLDSVEPFIPAESNFKQQP